MVHKRLKMSFTQGRGGPLFQATKEVYGYLRGNKWVRKHYKKIILTSHALALLALEYYKKKLTTRLKTLNTIVDQYDVHTTKIEQEVKAMNSIKNEQEGFFRVLRDKGFYEWLDKKHGITEIEKIPRKPGYEWLDER